MKRIIMIGFLIFSAVSCYSQAIEGKFTVSSIDSIDYYYMIYVRDSIGHEKLILSEIGSDNTIECNCTLQAIKPGDRYSLKLQEQLYICANREENVYIDILSMDYYVGKKLIASKYKVPYRTKSFYGLLYCASFEID